MKTHRALALTIKHGVAREDLSTIIEVKLEFPHGLGSEEQHRFVGKVNKDFLVLELDKLLG